MDALDIITVEQANRWLSLDEGDEDQDEDVERLIKSAVAWVERYTSYRLYKRPEVIKTRRWCTTISLFPFSVTSAKNSDDQDVHYTLREVSSLRSAIDVYCGTTITLEVGYATAADVPGPLLEACYKLITYWFENRDMYNVSLPTDVQMTINQFRRALI